MSQRLAILLPTLSGGGAERIMLNLARAFAEAGHAVDLVVLNDEGDLKSAIPQEVRLVALNVGRVWRAPGALVRYLRRERPAKLYTAMESAGVLALVARRLAGMTTPVICAVHNMLSMEAASGTGWREGAWCRLARLTYGTSTAVVAVSDRVAIDAIMQLRLSPDLVKVIENPVLLPELEALAARPVDHPWFASDAPPIVLACGRLVPQKDYPTLLDAFAIVRRRTRAHLLVLGEGGERQILLERAASLGIADDVAFPGFAPNPYAYMARCAVYVLSSRFEGSPVVLVEALACGCRIIATDCPSGPAELLGTLPGTTLIRVGDVAGLAREIEAALEASTPAGPRRLAEFDYRTAARSYLALGA